MSGVVTSLQDIVQRKQGGPCPMCSYIHPLDTLCTREALFHKIKKLMEANGLIPLMQSHIKEVTGMASQYLMMLKKAGDSHELLLEVLKEYGDIGEKIRLDYMERLDKWASQKSTSQDTPEQLELFSQNKSISKETETKNSMEKSTGNNLEPGFLK
jgi:hypothetical protein